MDGYERGQVSRSPQRSRGPLFHSRKRVLLPVCTPPVYRVFFNVDLGRDSQEIKFNILLTTYEIVLADVHHLRDLQWEQLIVDEGHKLKNQSTKLSLALQELQVDRRILLTGTPIQNSVEELVCFAVKV